MDMMSEAATTVSPQMSILLIAEKDSGLNKDNYSFVKKNLPQNTEANGGAQLLR